MTEYYLGVDIGGTHVRCGCISADNGELLCSLSVPVTEYTTFEELVDFITDSVSIMLEKESAQNCEEMIIRAVGIACPGQCKDGILLGGCIFRKYLSLNVCKL